MKYKPTYGETEEWIKQALDKTQTQWRFCYKFKSFLLQLKCNLIAGLKVYHFEKPNYA